MEHHDILVATFVAALRILLILGLIIVGLKRIKHEIENQPFYLKNEGKVIEIVSTWLLLLWLRLLRLRETSQTLLKLLGRLPECGKS